MKMSHFVCVLAVVVAGMTAAQAAHEGNFGVKIDAWMEGTIMKLDADAHKFEVRGAKRPYATEYAKMIRDINDKTHKLTGAEQQKKADEIRNSYADNLEKARTQERSKESDFTFYVPDDGMVMVHDETAAYNRDPKSNQVNEPAKATDKERASMQALKDFHIGQYVVVGYESGVAKNTSFVIIKANKPMDTVPAEHKATESKTTIGTGLNANDEQARQIRRAIVDDKSLSTAAHNVVIDFKDGIAHLKGTVPTEAEKKAVEAKASSVVGDTKVMSHIEVGK